MPTPYLKKLNKQGKGSMKDLEHKWDKAEDLADDQGQGDNYAYRTGILKRMVGAGVVLNATARLLLANQEPEAYNKQQKTIMAIRQQKTKLKAASRLLTGMLLHHQSAKAQSKFKAGDWVIITIPYSSQGRHVQAGQNGIVVGQPKWSDYSKQFMVEVKTMYDTSPFKEEHLKKDTDD